MITYFSLLAFSVLSVGACPAGWIGTEGGPYCYLVSRDPMNWFAAQEVKARLPQSQFIVQCFQFCWDNGAYLAEFLTSEEEARVNDILAKDLDYWIGLADFAHEGQYQSKGQELGSLLE